MDFVIGSGPSGIACAKALSEAGRSVTILDGGYTLEPERERARAAIAQRDDFHVGERVGAEPRKGAGRGEIPRKLVHGSDYPYRATPVAAEIRSSGPLGIEGSFAAGGLSNVWGAAILPYRQEDLAYWPVTEAELRPFYTEILKFIPVAAKRDGLASLFPLPVAALESFRPSSQAERLMRALDASQEQLSAKGVFFGGSRLAVDAGGRRSQAPCIYCGHCLHGCPRDLIWSGRQTLTDLCSDGRIAYLRGLTVKSVEDAADRARVHAVKFDGSTHVFDGERVFLAAGPLNSTMILLRSLGWYDRPVQLRDSQYFLFPMLQFRGSTKVTEARLHTLSQIFIEIFDKAISENVIHLQIYTYNDHLADMLDDKFGPLKHMFSRNMLLGRLLLVQGFLHSSVSATIGATLHRNGDSDWLSLEPALNPETKRKVRQVVRKLSNLTRLTGAAPAAPLLQIAEPGRGFHSGGSFPMARSPGPGQTDRWGRPFGLERVHVVDSTVFPSIPATTITLTIMANAYRIGSEVSRMDARLEA